MEDTTAISVVSRLVISSSDFKFPREDVGKWWRFRFCTIDSIKKRDLETRMEVLAFGMFQVG